MKTQIEILHEIAEERQKQDMKWGEQNHEPQVWCCILTEEVGELNKAALESMWFDKGVEPCDYRAELVQVAAVAVAMIECHDRKYSK